MKHKYGSPNVSIKVFTAEDVLTVSAESMSGATWDGRGHYFEDIFN